MVSGIAWAGGVGVPAVLGVATLAAKLFRLLLLSAMLMTSVSQCKMCFFRSVFSVSSTSLEGAPRKRVREAFPWAAVADGRARSPSRCLLSNASKRATRKEEANAHEKVTGARSF